MNIKHYCDNLLFRFIVIIVRKQERVVSMLYHILGLWVIGSCHCSLTYLQHVKCRAVEPRYEGLNGVEVFTVNG